MSKQAMKKLKGGDRIPELDSGSGQDSADVQELKATLRQHWEHSRHCEIQILWFTNIYAVVVAAILVFISETSGDSTTLVPIFLLALFGLILSIIGFLIMVALTLGHLNHKMNVFIILYYWDKMEFYSDPEKPVHYKTAHRWFFEITIALFSALSLLFCASEDWTSPEVPYEQKALLIVAFIIIFVVIEILYRMTWRNHTRDRIRFREALKSDTEGYYRKDWDEWFKKPGRWKELVEDATERGILVLD